MSNLVSCRINCLLISRSNLQVSETEYRCRSVLVSSNVGLIVDKSNKCKSQCIKDHSGLNKSNCTNIQVINRGVAQKMHRCWVGMTLHESRKIFVELARHVARI